MVFTFLDFTHGVEDLPGWWIACFKIFEYSFRYLGHFVRFEPTDYSVRSSQFVEGSCLFGTLFEKLSLQCETITAIGSFAVPGCFLKLCFVFALNC